MGGQLHGASCGDRLTPCPQRVKGLWRPPHTLPPARQRAVATASHPAPSASKGCGDRPRLLQRALETVPRARPMPPAGCPPRSAHHQPTPPPPPHPQDAATPPQPITSRTAPPTWPPHPRGPTHRAPPTGPHPHQPQRQVQPRRPTPRPLVPRPRSPPPVPPVVSAVLLRRCTAGVRPGGGAARQRTHEAGPQRGQEPHVRRRAAAGGGVAAHAEAGAGEGGAGRLRSRAGRVWG
jgi:hypothetical protein